MLGNLFALIRALVCFTIFKQFMPMTGPKKESRSAALVVVMTNARLELLLVLLLVLLQFRSAHRSVVVYAHGDMAQTYAA